MKRLLSLLLTVSTLLSLCACSGGSDHDAAESTPTEAVSQTQGAEVAEVKTYDVALKDIEITKLPEIVVPDDASQSGLGSITIENDNIRFAVNASSGISIASIYDKRIGHEYLSQQENLFTCYVVTDLEVDGFDKSRQVESSNGVAVAEVYTANGGNELYILSKANELNLSFLTKIRLTDDGVGIATQITSEYGEEVVIRMTCPSISKLNVAGDDPWACVPHELGWVAPYDDQSVFGAAVSGNTGISGMPTYTNSLELATVYSKDGTGGIYLMDSQGDIEHGIPRIQMGIANKRITGEWAYTAAAQETVTMSELLIGMYVNDDWHAAVNAYKENHAVTLSVAEDIPQWLREAGAIYSTRWGGAGGPYQLLDVVDISYMYINNYEQMDRLYSLAEKYGTNVMMLSDYQIAAKASPMWDELTEGVDVSQITHHFYIQPYENKGDYHIVRPKYQHKFIMRSTSISRR